VSDKRPADAVRFVNKSHHWRDALRMYGAESGMTKNALAVVMMLEIHANPDGSDAYPGETLLAKRLDTSVSTVSRGMTLARELGWVFCTQAGNYRVGESNVWRMCIPSHVPISEGETKAGVLKHMPVTDGRQSKRTPKEPTVENNQPLTSAPQVVDRRPTAQRRREYEQMVRDEGGSGE
jgi:hypothetical protein